jgi:CubicO group peptidase (beta-lactamase class C family)
MARRRRDATPLTHGWTNGSGSGRSAGRGLFSGEHGPPFGRRDDDVFAHANPDPGNIDLAALSDMLSGAIASGTESTIVAIGDTIVTEKYFGHSGDLTSIQSVTKSISSLLIGILIDQGRIASVDVPLSTYYPEWNDHSMKSRVTLRHVLTMSSGVIDPMWRRSLHAPARSPAHRPARS